MGYYLRKNGNITLKWKNNTPTGVTFPDGTTIMEICFTAIGAQGNETALQFVSPASATDTKGGIVPSFKNGTVAINSPTCRSRDSTALVSFNKQTNGGGWTNRWDFSATIHTWYGVKTNISGCVVDLNLGGEYLGNISSGNKLKGKLPAVIGDLANLTNLNLRYNDLKGDMPTEIGKLTNLTAINLVSCGLTNEIPASFWQLTNLNSINVRSNKLTGSLSKEIGNLKKLQAIYVEGNLFSGNIPTEIGNLTELQTLGLSGNDFSGTIPKEIGNLTKLLNLWLNNTPKITGTIPPEIGNCTALNYISLGGGYDSNTRSYIYSKLGGAIPPEIGKLKNLTNLVIEYAEINTIPKEIGALSNLNYLGLDYNKIQNIPAEIGNLSAVTQISLQSNQITDSIPTWMGNLSKLTYLTLGNNKIKGTIPTNLGNLSKLQTLYLSNNQLTGTIPKELGKLIEAQYINIDNNLLSGTIPAELGSLPKIRSLSLHKNKLEGEVPATFRNLVRLISLRLNDNRLTSLPDMSAITFGTLYNEGLAGQNNQLTFKDILPNIKQFRPLTTNYVDMTLYHPQDSIGQRKSVDLVFKKPYSLRLGIDSLVSGSVYKWSRNGKAYATRTVPYLDFNTVVDTIKGIYTCKVTNVGAPLLTLNSRPVTISVQPCPALVKAQTVTLCTGKTLKVGTKKIYDKTGVFKDTLRTVDTWCDSIVTSNLTILPIKSFKQNIVLCAGKQYTIAKNTYTKSGIYDYAFKTADGCDTVVTTNLTILPINETTQKVTRCQGQSYKVGDSTYVKTGKYTNLFKSWRKCDSTVMTTLTITPPDPLYKKITICSGSTLTINKTVYDKSGDYTHQYKTFAGCDSTVITQLTVSPQKIYKQDITLCPKDSIKVANRFYAKAGIYTDEFKTKLGCDTTVITTVTTIPAIDAVTDTYEYIWERKAAKPTEFAVTQNDKRTKDWELRVARHPSLPFVEVSDIGDKMSVLIRNFEYQGTFSFGYKLCDTQCKNNCDTATVFITVKTRPDFTPDAFTPNGDGFNDLFEFEEIRDDPQRYPECQFEVINRWGDVIYYAKPYKNDWDGTFQASGVPVPEGTYYYVMRFSLGEPKVKIGQILVIRGRQ